MRRLYASQLVIVIATVIILQSASFPLLQVRQRMF